MDIFGKLAEKIIEQQEGIIGPIALEQAEKVSGLSIDWKKHTVTVDGKDKTAVIEHLIEQYKALFGQASVEACKDAVKSIIQDLPKESRPSLLQ